MGYQKCITEIQNAAGGRLTEDDIESLLGEIIQRSRRNEKRSLAEPEKFRIAAKEMAQEIETALAIEKANAIRNLEKRVARREHYREAAEVTGDLFLAVESKINGINTPVSGGRKSAEAINNAIRRELTGALAVDLERSGLMRAFQTDALLREWVTELSELNKGDAGKPGITGDKNALALAKVLHKYQRAAVEKMNGEGAWIRDYFAYVTKTSHDPDAIRRAGADQWIEDVMSRIDLDRTFGGSDIEARKALAELWIDFKDGNHLRFDDALEEVAFPGMNVAKKVSASRVLHWKTSDDWLAYTQKYGSGGAREVFLAGLERAAKSTALMQVYGTNPRAAFESDLDWVATEFRGADDRVRKFTNSRKGLVNRFDHLDGTAQRPENRLASDITAWTLAGQRWSKLGGASLSAVTDIAFKAAELRYQGVPVLERWSGALTGYFRGRGTKEGKEIADLMLAGLESRMGQMALRYDVFDNQPGTISRVDNIFFKLTGLTQMTVNQRADSEVIMAAHLGKMQKKGWSKLPPETSRALKMAGVSPAQWEMLRSVEWTKPGERTYLTPDAARNIPDETVKAHLLKTGKINDKSDAAAKVRVFKDDLATTLAAYYADRGTYAVLETGVRERAILLRGTKSGTPEGIAARLLVQFKAFPTAVLARAWGREIHGGQGRMGAVSGLVQMISTGMMMGYAAMVLKDIVKGREPRIPDLTDIAGTGQILAAALVQSGGLGIYGDFLFGNHNRFGQGPLEVLAGPTLSQGAELFKIYAAFRDGDDASAKAIRMAINSVPGANLWWTRTALDHLILYDIQDALNPGSVRRMERTIEKNNDQRFWLSPSESVR
jgi:hypothetical protein